ncbi:MAG: hypothetical protein ABIY51_03985 [Ferruginibacter sp.]
MTNNGKLATLALAGLAAYAYKKYSKMSPEQKESLGSDLKERGRGLVEKYLPENVRSLFGLKTDNTSTTGQPNPNAGF